MAHVSPRTRATRERTASPVGQLLRQWRERRGLSQLALAVEAEISARHLSFIETDSRERRERRLAGAV